MNYIAVYSRIPWASSLFGIEMAFISALHRKYVCATAIVIHVDELN